MRAVLLFFLAITLVLFLYLPAKAANVCLADGHTAIYINGILTDENEAERNLKILQRVFDKESKVENVSFKLGYNPSHAGGLGDVVQSVSQVLFSPISEFDKKTILMQIHPEIKTQKVLLVGHSQGTFYTNEIYEYLVDNGLSEESIGVYNIATPASLVGGNGGYLTSTNDTMISTVRALSIKNKVPGPLPANIDLPLTDLSLLPPKRGHSFTTEYLANAPLRIVSDIEKALSKLKVNSRNNSSNGCFNKPEKSFGYNLEKASFALLDSTVGGVITEAKVAKAVIKEASKIAFVSLHPYIKNFLAEAFLNRTKYKAPVEGQGGAVVLSGGAPEIPKETPVQEPEAIISLAEPTTEPSSEVALPNSVLQEPLPEIVVPDNSSQEVLLEASPEQEETFPALPDDVEVVVETDDSNNKIPGYQPGFGGGGGGGSRGTSPSTVVVDNTPPDSPIIMTPSSFSSPFSTTTITFIGTAESGTVISNSFSSSTTEALGGDWSIELNFPVSTTTVTFYATDSSGNKNDSGTTVEVEVKLSADAPVITSPASFSTAFGTTTINFEGTAEVGAVISQDFSSATTTTSADGAWTLSLGSFAEGNMEINFLATNNGFISPTTTVNFVVDITPPTINSFQILECVYSLSPLYCLSGSEEVHLIWSATGTPSTFNIFRDGIFQKSIAGESTTLAIPDGLSASVEVVAVDEAGNSGTSTAETVNISIIPIVINEIAWAGTESSSTDEWIEIYNRTEDNLDLSNLKLVSTDGVPVIALSGTLSSRPTSHTNFGHYLIERTASTTTSVTENFVSPFSGDGAGSGLSNTHEELQLVHYLGGLATTTIDSTPSVSSCGGVWCGGLASTSPFSMERINVNILGTLSANWTTNDGVTINGIDADGNNLNATPASENSQSINGKKIGYYCNPKNASYLPDNYYLPNNTSSSNLWCTYLSYSLSGKRHGYVFKGNVGSSEVLFGHYLNQSKDKSEKGNNFVGEGVIQGDEMFTVIFEVRTGPAFDDLNDFLDYFTGDSPSAPHDNYGILEWKYGNRP